ncbi:MAG: 6-phosphogluconolactonase [Candidatus Longimicrobiales bacterium M2_2A_002]
MTGRTIRVLPDAEAASRAAAEEVAGRIRVGVRERGRFAIALAGGRTPRRMYELLATTHHDLPWERVRVYWGDERCVPPDDTRSNYGMARGSLLDHVPVPEEAVHRIRGERGAEAAAAGYGPLIAAAETRDLVLLGAGADGHTASLFPGQLERDDARWARGVVAPPGTQPRERVTLTLRALNAFTAALFLVTGPEKQSVVAAVRGTRDAPGGSDDDPGGEYPALRVRPDGGALWIIDLAATGA